jgi:hypothetical protein
MPSLGLRGVLVWITMSGFVVAQNGLAQNALMSGTISNKEGPVSRATVRIRATGAETGYDATSDAKGSYSVQLPAGIYDFFATAAGNVAFTKRGIVVKAGDKVTVNGVLPLSANEGTPGELTFLHMGDERDVPKGPTPRLGKFPDLSGIWYASADLEPEDPPFQKWAADYAKTHTPGSDPRARCLPSGVARANQNELSKIVQTGDLIVILYEGSPPGVRQIFLDGRNHPPPGTFDPTWMGHSIGHWEGKTLVVDTTGFNNKGWVDYRMTPQTEQLHVIERYTRPDLGHLDLEVIVEDPGAYTRPWKIRRRMNLAPKTEEIQEYICEGDDDSKHLGQ